MDNLDKVKDKIEKLFRKAESAGEMGSLDEAAAFTAKAQAILTKYNLDMADIKVEQDGNTCEGERNDLKEKHGWTKTDGDWLIKLYSTISRHNFCKIVVHKMYKSTEPMITIIGEPHNIEMVKYICSHLVPKIKQLRLQRWKEYNGYEKTNAFKRGYYRGAVQGINAKLVEQRDNDKSKYTGLQGLIVLSDALVDEKMAELFSNLTNGGRSRSLSGASGAMAGYKDGKNMNINKGVGASDSSSGRLLN